PSLVLLLWPILSSSQSATPTAQAIGRFEVYCDGVGVSLEKVDGAPEPRKLVLFSSVSFPPGTMGGAILGQGMWKTVSVLKGGRLPDGKCKSVGEGRIWIDTWDMSESGDKAPRHISGKYEIELNGKQLQGPFIARIHNRKKPIRLCM